jgi:hypothetical protein
MIAGLAVVDAAPAQAAPCETDGHAYLTQPGRVIFSGYNADKRFGVPRIITFQGDRFRLGGNGINPNGPRADNHIRWRAERRSGPGDAAVSLGSINFLPGVFSYISVSAQDNCVVHEEGPFPVSADPGHYRIYALYVSGNNARPDVVNVDPVADLQVFPAPTGPQPSPGPTPRLSSSGAATASTDVADSMMSSGYTDPPTVVAATRIRRRASTSVPSWSSGQPTLTTGLPADPRRESCHVWENPQVDDPISRRRLRGSNPPASRFTGRGLGHTGALTFASVGPVVTGRARRDPCLTDAVRTRCGP